jgi:hypothetical protein
MPGRVHAPVKRVWILQVRILEQGDTKATSQRCHFSTLGGDDSGVKQSQRS